MEMDAPVTGSTRALHRLLLALDRASDDNAEFHVLRDRHAAAVQARNLIVLVHPGDMIEPDHDPAALARQSGLAAELAAHRDFDFLVLHRNSCSQLGAGDPTRIDPRLRHEIETGWERGTILHGDDLDAAAAWIVAHMRPASRDRIFLAGAYGDRDHGCLSLVGARLEEAGARIDLSAHIPCPGGTAWMPNPYEKTRLDPLFHATRLSKIPSIMDVGLLPNEDRDPTFDGYPTEGRLFASKTESGAEFYLRMLENDFDSEAVILRFPTPTGAPLNEDPFGNLSDVWIDRAIPPGEIEIRVGQTWEKLADTDLGRTNDPVF